MTTRNIGKIIIVMAALAFLSLNAWATPYLPPDPGVGDPYLGTYSGTTPTLIGYDTVPPSNNGMGTIADSFTSLGVPMAEASLVKYDASSGWGTAVTDNGDGTVTIDARGFHYMMVFYGGGGGHPGQFFYDIGAGGGVYRFEKQALSDVVFGNQVPAPAAVWLLGTGLAGLIGIRRKMKK